MHKDDIERNITENEQELDEYLAKIYEKNMERIINISGTIKISQTIGIFSFFIFLIILAIRVSKNFDFSWFYLLIPSIITLVSFTVLLNSYLKLKDIFDEAEKQKEEDISQIGSILTYFCLNSISLNLFVYFILFSLQIENIIQLQWNLIAIPLYITFGIAMFYWIFIFPAFLQNKLYAEILIILAYISCTFTMFLLLNFKMDKSYVSGFFNIFIAGLFALGLHAVYLFFNLFISLKTEFFQKLTVLSLVLNSFVSLVLIGLKADELTSGYDYWVPVVMIIFAYTLIVANKLVTLVFGEKEDDKEKDLH